MRAVFGSKDLISGITDRPQSMFDINLYPNPLSDLLNIKTTGIDIDHISIYDIYGRLMIQAAGGIDNIDVSALLPGIYQVVFYTDNVKSIARKIVISH